MAAMSAAWRLPGCFPLAAVFVASACAIHIPHGDTSGQQSATTSVGHDHVALVTDSERAERRNVSIPATAGDAAAAASTAMAKTEQRAQQISVQKEDVPRVSRSPCMWAFAICIPLFLLVATSDVVPVHLVICLWVMGGIMMNIVNKIAAVIFPQSFLLVIMQMAFAIVFLLSTEAPKMRCGSVRDVAKWMIVPFLFSGILATSLLSFKKASLSTVMICRNVLPLITFSIEKTFLNTPATVGTDLIISMLAMLGGVALYTKSQSGTTSQSFEGLLMVYLNALFCACDRLCQSSLLKSKSFDCSLSLCLLLNNCVGMVPVLMLAVATGEVHGWPRAVARAEPITWLWVSISCCCGFCLGYLGLKTQKAVTATTSLMLQNVMKVVLIFIGVMWFGDHLGLLGSVGCAVAICSGLWYGYLRLPAETSVGGSAREEPSKARSNFVQAMGKQKQAEV